MTDLADNSEHIENFCTAVKERGTEVIFLRRIQPGGADKSYGIQVAKLAGLPKSVMKRAEEILQEMENSTPTEAGETKKIAPQPTQNLFMSNGLKEFLNLDVTTLTPIEAMNKLYELQKKAREESGR